MTIETRLAEIRARADAAADLGSGSILHALISTTHALALLAAVVDVRDLHQPEIVAVLAGHEGEPWCSLCRGPYPCETITAITTALEVQG